jgi:alpha-beta hydrolase superfamily lysophospholipase
MAKRILIACILLILCPILYVAAVSVIGSARLDPAEWASAVISDDHAYQWFRKSRATRLQGVAVVVHGLNLRPERMESVIGELNRAGIDVLNVSLRGHGRNFTRSRDLSMDDARLESFRNVSYRMWSGEVRGAYLRARQRASDRNVPLFFVGYSLGGVLGCNLLLTDPDVAYDGMILFSPALNITAKGYLLKPLMPFPSIVIDSLAPLSYRANEGTPMAAYRAVFEAVADFEKCGGPRLNIPTAVFVDEKDEFISPAEVAQSVARLGLDRWRIHWVQKGPDGRESLSHHVLIDETSVGRNTWRSIGTIMRQQVTLRKNGGKPVGERFSSGSTESRGPFMPAAAVAGR